jgi:hypothetical protein
MSKMFVECHKKMAQTPYRKYDEKIISKRKRAEAKRKIVKIVCLVLVVFGYIFSAYILLYFIVSYRFTQRGSFVYCCFSQQSGIRARCDRAPLSDYSVKYLVLNNGG